MEDESGQTSTAAEVAAELAAEADTGTAAAPADQNALDPDQELAERLKREAEENYDKYVRALAELENFKKRALKERSDLLKYAGENIARDVLEVIDDLERALKVDVDGAGAELKKGLQMVFDRFQSVLEKHAIKRENSLGQDFDPSKHEAMTMVATTDHKPGKVIEEFRAAYYFKDRLLRPAQVVVAKAPETEEKN